MKKARHIKHYSDDRKDALMVSVRCLYGMEGYGVYWAIMEILSASDCYSLPTEYEQIAKELNVSTELVMHIVEDHGLFVVSDGQFYSQRLSEEMGIKDRISEARREAGTIGMKSRYHKGTDTKNRKYTPDETSLHTMSKKHFDECYKFYKNEDFYWSGKEMKAIVGILKQVRFHMAEDEKDDTAKQLDYYKKFIIHVFTKADGWIIDHISPSLINSKFNEIYLQIKHGKSERPGQIADASQFVDRL